MGSGVWEHGSPRGWRSLRAYVLNRDGYVCRLQLPGCTGKATQVHHTLGAQLTGVVCSPDLLQAACRPCNRGLGDPSKGRQNQEHRGMTKW